MATVNAGGLRNITGYTVQEDATPLDAAATDGGVGTIQFAVAEDGDSLAMFDQDIELNDDFRGTTSGTVSGIALTNGINSVTADTRLGALVGKTYAMPMNGTFETVARYYLSVGGITEGVYFDPRIAGIPVVAQGWQDDAWLKLKQLAIANRVEICVVSNKIVFRPVRSVIADVRKKTDFTVNIAKTDAAQAIEVTYYGNQWVDGEVVYPRTLDEAAAAQVYTVEAGGTLEDDIQLSVSVASVLQPICVDDVAQDYDGSQSVYSVRAIDNSLVTAQEWTAMGGKVELTVNPDTVSIHIKITGSKDQYRGPYRLAGRMKEITEDPSTMIVGPGQTTATVSGTAGMLTTPIPSSATPVTNPPTGSTTTSGSTTTTTVRYPAAVDDYPWPTRTIGTLSPLRYDYRECVDFVAWRLNRDAGVRAAPWKWTWGNLRITNGNAIGWYNDWKLHGWKVDIAPVPGAIAWFGTSAGAYGHVAYVQAVTSDSVVLEDYNWGRTHSYHKHTMLKSQVDSFLANPAGSTAIKTTTTTPTAVAPTTTPTVNVPAGSPTIAGYSGVQLTNAAYIMKAAIAENFGANLTKAQQIGVMTAMGESSLRVLDYGDAAGPDSRGLFQQRTSWGTLAQRMDPYQSAILFYNALKKVSGWTTMTPTHAAHAVQINADPEYYTQYYSAAKTVVAALAGSTTTTSTPSNTTATVNNTTPAVSSTSPADSEIDYNALRIVGTGAIIEKNVITLPTGNAPSETATDVGITIENIFVDNLNDAYRVGSYTATRYKGEEQTLSGTLTTINQRSGSGALIYPDIADFDAQYKGMTIAQFNAQWAGKTLGQFKAVQKERVIDTEQNQVFGNVAGARFRYKDAYYRITTSTISNSGIDFSATRDTMIADFNAAHSGKTIADFNAQYAGKTLKQFGRAPLQGG